MKAKLFLVLFTLNLSSFAQLSYTPFPEGEAVWHVLKMYPYTNVPEHWQYMYVGDTSFSGYNYHKISLKNEYVNFSDGNLLYDDNGVIGYLRQDSLAKKVYFVERNFPEEYLLYDFSLQIGDTFIITYQNLGPSNNIVHARDSVLVGNSFRTRFILFPLIGTTVDSLDSVKIIEGIGYSSGLLIAETTFCFETCFRLACFQQDGETLYTPDVSPAWDSYPFGYCHIVGVSETENQKNKFLLHPNLVAKGDKCKLTTNYEEKIEVLVYDLFGEVMWKQNFDHESQLEIPTDNLLSRIYLVKIFAGEKLLSIQKLVVQ